MEYIAIANCYNSVLQVRTDGLMHFNLLSRKLKSKYEELIFFKTNFTDKKTNKMMCQNKIKTLLNIWYHVIFSTLILEFFIYASKCYLYIPCSTFFSIKTIFHTVSSLSSTCVGIFWLIKYIPCSTFFSPKLHQSSTTSTTAACPPRTWLTGPISPSSTELVPWWDSCLRTMFRWVTRVTMSINSYTVRILMRVT